MQVTVNSKLSPPLGTLQQSVGIELPKMKSRKENKAQEEAVIKELRGARPASKELANAAEDPTVADSQAATRLVARPPNEGDSILKSASEDIEAAAAYARARSPRLARTSPTSCRGATAGSTGAIGDATSFPGSGALRKNGVSATVQVT